MNYRMGWSSLCWVAGKRLRRRYRNPAYPLDPLSGEAFVELLATTLGWYRPEVNRSQLNLLDSHDVPRALHTLQGENNCADQSCPALHKSKHHVRAFTGLQPATQR